MKIKFSVLINLYNKEETIDATIESVMAQSYQNFELIICDFSSTDKSLDVAKKFHSDRVKIISEKNYGISLGKNYLSSLATGQYLVFLDADDLWHPDLLLNVSEACTDCQALIVAANYVNSQQEFRDNKIAEPYVFYDGKKYLARRLCLFGLQTSFVFIQRDVFEQSCKFPWEVCYPSRRELKTEKGLVASIVYGRSDYPCLYGCGGEVGYVSIPGPGGEDQFLIDNLILKHGVLYLPKVLGEWRNDVEGQASLTLHTGFWPSIFIDFPRNSLGFLYFVHQAFGYLKFSLKHWGYFEAVRINFRSRGSRLRDTDFFVIIGLGAFLRAFQWFYVFYCRVKK